VIQGVLEADEFPDQGIVAAMGLVSLMGQKVIEVEFGFDIVSWGGFHEPCTYESGARHANEACGHGVAVFMIV